MEKNFWMFGDSGRDEPVRGEELIRATDEEAAYLATVPAEFRWEAAQGETWTPSSAFAAWKNGL